jgi:hypothetical protein
MSSPIRPDGFSKYAPRWVREGTGKPRDAVSLPPAPQLASVHPSEPPWRGPSPFEGDVRQWRGRPTRPPTEPPVEMPLVTRPPQVGVVDRLFRTAAVVVFAGIAMGALALLLFPEAEKEMLATRRPAPVPPSETQSARSMPPKTMSRVGVPDPQPAPVDVARAEPAPPTPVQTVPVQPAPVQTVPVQPVQVQTIPVRPPQNGNSGFAVASAEPPAPRAAWPAPAEAPAPAAAPIQAAAPSPPVQAAPPLQAAPRLPASNSVQEAAPLAPQRVHSQRILSAEECDRLISRGEAFLAQGDVAAARLVLMRAAEARDPRAALTLGSTYDPNVLRKMGVVGVQPDADQAKAWYERAADFGSGDANQRLSALAELTR